MSSTNGKSEKVPGWQIAGTGSRALKAGAYGMQGSGKTTTMALIALMIANRLKKSTAYMIDSEGGADYVDSLFRHAKIELKVLRTREFGQLVNALEAMRDTDEVVLIDSVTHFWNDVVKTYMESTKRQKLRVQDWGPIFETWRLFTSVYVNSQIHALVCGRMGYEYANATDEQGNLEFYKSDTKMKAGEQFGHEPDLLLFMEQLDNATLRDEFRLAGTKQKRQQIAQKLQNESQINIVATVEKDRTRLLMAKRFVFSPGEDAQMIASVEHAFSPVVDWHLGQKTTAGLAETGATRAMLAPSGAEFDWQEKKRRRDVALDEIKSTMQQFFPSSSSPAHKKALIDIQEKVFGVKSWTAIEQTIPLETLEEAVKPLPDEVPSRLEQACIKQSELVEATKA